MKIETVFLILSILVLAAVSTLFLEWEMIRNYSVLMHEYNTSNSFNTQFKNPAMRIGITYFCNIIFFILANNYYDDCKKSAKGWGFGLIPVVVAFFLAVNWTWLVYNMHLA